MTAIEDAGVARLWMPNITLSVEFIKDRLYDVLAYLL